MTPVLWFFLTSDLTINLNLIQFLKNGIMNDYSKTSPARGSAMNSNDAGDTVARLFSNAHESEVTSNLILEVQMDLHNNNVGHTIGDDASIFISDQDLSSSVYQSLLNGLLVYLSPLDAVLPPNFGINSSTQIIPTN